MRRGGPPSIPLTSGESNQEKSHLHECPWGSNAGTVLDQMLQINSWSTKLNTKPFFPFIPHGFADGQNLSSEVGALQYVFVNS